VDKPLERHLKIGRATVGLLGLDSELSRLLSQEINRDDAVAELYNSISKGNYIPSGSEDLYREALAKEYDRLVSGQQRQETDLTIRILGPGCVSCNNLQTMVIEIMAKLDIGADIFQIHDLDEIGRFGVIQTPALIVNGQLKSAGRLPTSSQIEAWLQE
jgi:small redox-active disulfide protein 2